ncbi:hypothetical protein [Rhodococcus pyridinivorans]|uniref:Uncharacterized protein n=1 Tax=Rhodococcus pyridinivorans TaxID=103816 RepID=A0A7M2XID5_9NOCA|nr:hypothetical protein [Rhodococcus pyridinivorans]QOV97173.1 hypothetical protein INP59_14440 [Rhodococcus pyridinivorans]
MIDVKIGFKNGTVLNVHAHSFEVVTNPLGSKTYQWDCAGLNTRLRTLDADEVLWVTTSGHLAQEKDA